LGFDEVQQTLFQANKVDAALTTQKELTVDSAKLSVITPVFQPDIKELRECLQSARGPGIEHILALDGFHTQSQVRKIRKLCNRYGAKLEVLAEQGGISVASNLAASSSSGEFLVFLDQDDVLAKNWWAPVLEALDGADFIYSDSFLADESGKAVRLVRKPNWSPHRLIFNMYAVHFMAVRKNIFVDLGGFRSEFDGSQDHDLALRVSEVSQRFVHLPMPLYSWRASKKSTASNPNNKEWAYLAGQAAAQDHIHKLVPGTIIERIVGYPGALKASYPRRSEPVSIVIPTAFKLLSTGFSHLDHLLTGLIPFLDASLGDEIILVHGGENPSGFFGKVISECPVAIISVEDNEDFYFSRRSNIGFLAASHEHVLLLNDDIEFMNDNPLDALFGTLRMPNVGLVGGLLFYPGLSVQHGGQAFTGGLPHHAHQNSESLEVGLYDLLVDHEVVGVTGALMFQRKSTWQAVGGFSGLFPMNFNDVDYCQKIRALGYTIILANAVNAIHHESATREPIVHSWEITRLTDRWKFALAKDDYSVTG
jgi:GT2 family glycosyltransferase